MISELLGHVAAVVSMRNAVPCGISDAKESRMIFGNAEVLPLPKWFSLSRSNGRPAWPGQPVRKSAAPLFMPLNFQWNNINVVICTCELAKNYVHMTE